MTYKTQKNERFGTSLYFFLSKKSIVANTILLQMKIKIMGDDCHYFYSMATITMITVQYAYFLHII